MRAELFDEALAPCGRSGWIPTCRSAEPTSKRPGPCGRRVQSNAATRLRCLDELAGYGANWAVVQVDGSSPQAAADFIKAFGEAVITAG
jgi:hypothetical protein